MQPKKMTAQKKTYTLLLTKPRMKANEGCRPEAVSGCTAKKSTFFEKPTDRTAGCPDGRQSSPVRQKPRNTQKPGISEAI